MKKGKWKISLKSLISVRWQKHLPRLVIHEKYEKFVKWGLRLLTAFGIVSSVIAFHIWYISLSFAIVLFLIEQFFEKSIFQYTSIYVQPMPDFKYDPKEWRGMAFAFPQDPDPKLLNVVGCAFATEEYGKEHQQLIMQMVFCKIFPYGANSQLKMFLEKQFLDHPFWLKPFIMKENGQIEMVHNEDPILKYHYKFKSRQKLNKNEYEYQHGKNVMKK